MEQKLKTNLPTYESLTSHWVNYNIEDVVLKKRKLVAEKPKFMSLRKTRKEVCDMEKLKNEMYHIVKSGNVPKLKDLLNDYTSAYKKLQEENPEITIKEEGVLISELLNQEIDEEMNTPLHIATYQCRLPMVKFLVENKAVVSTENKIGETAYYIAHCRNYRNIMNFLQLNLVKKLKNSSITEVPSSKEKHLTRLQLKKAKNDQIMSEDKKKFLELDDKKKKTLFMGVPKKGYPQIIKTSRCLQCGEIIEERKEGLSEDWYCSLLCEDLYIKCTRKK